MDSFIGGIARNHRICPEESVPYDHQAVDPKKVRPIQMGEFLAKYVSRRLSALSEGEIAAPHDRNAAVRSWGLKAAPRPSPSFTSSSSMNGFQDP